jgi:transposase
LTPDSRDDYYFTLQQEWNTYQHIQNQIKQTDEKIAILLKEIIDKDDNKKQHITKKKPFKRKNKNTNNKLDFNQVSCQYLEGVDLMAIEGIKESTIMTIISEFGLEGIKKIESAKQFTSCLRLAPNNKISGGKVLSHHLPKGTSRLKLALRNAANALGQLKEGHLNTFFKKINYKKGRATAVSALAIKLAVIIWNMVTKRLNYQPPTQYLCLDEKRKLGLVKKI